MIRHYEADHFLESIFTGITRDWPIGTQAVKHSEPAHILGDKHTINCAQVLPIPPTRPI